jgi:DNA-binding transcriptional MerR regulator
MKDATTYSIGELAEAAGVSRRTVRFYVQQGLLPAPEGLGRGAHYLAAHLGVLLRIKQMQLDGVPLGEIGGILAGEAGGPGTGGRGQRDRGPVRSPDSAARTPIPTLAGVVGQLTVRQPLGPGYELHVTRPGRPLSHDELAELGSLLSSMLHDGREDR